MALFIVIAICDLLFLVMLARGALSWFSNRGGDLGPLVFLLDPLESVTNPLLYPIRRLLPEEKRDGNLPVAIAIGILLLILVPFYGYWIISGLLTGGSTAT